VPTNQEKKPLSLHPLTFEEAVTDILKIKPMPKPPKKKRTASKLPNAPETKQ
jgi:hypothetical protein